MLQKPLPWRPKVVEFSGQPLEVAWNILLLVRRGHRSVVQGNIIFSWLNEFFGVIFVVQRICVRIMHHLHQQVDRVNRVDGVNNLSLLAEPDDGVIMSLNKTTEETGE